MQGAELTDSLCILVTKAEAGLGYHDLSTHRNSRDGWENTLASCLWLISESDDTICLLTGDPAFRRAHTSSHIPLLFSGNF